MYLKWDVNWRHPVDILVKAMSSNADLLWVLMLKLGVAAPLVRYVETVQ